MSAVYICECTHPKSQHKRERDGCRALDCGCAKFEADMDASAKAQGADRAERTRVLTAVAEVCEDQAAKARAELAGAPDTMSTSARLVFTEQRLAETERERDEAAGEAERLFGLASTAMQERDRFAAAADKLHGEWLDLKAELVSARQEIERLRARLPLPDNQNGAPMADPMSPAEMIAGVFHATYETLAPEHGYETRKASAVAWEDVPENNRTLMIATVQNMLDSGVIHPGALAFHVLAKAKAKPTTEPFKADA